MSMPKWIRGSLGLWAIAAGNLPGPPAQAEEPIDIGSRLELFADETLIGSMTGDATLELHQPVRRNVAMVTDAPWEGNAAHYRSVFKDGDTYRMYYSAWQYDVDKEGMRYPHVPFLCYAESKNGIEFIRPDLGLHEFQGSKANNILFTPETFAEVGFDPGHVAVFKDANPDCPPDEQYKAIGVGKDPRGIHVLGSGDGIHFELLTDEPVITDGAFDSQNLAFWDPVREEYRAYIRDFRDGIRGIKTSTSPDCLDWTEPEWLVYPDAPTQALYTNQIQPYYRAPHIVIGFPMRYNDRGWSPSMRALPNLEHREMRAAAHPRYGTTVTDAAFMASRDRQTFKRYSEAFIRPGPLDNNWVYGDNSVAWGVVETQSNMNGAPNELSLYATEGYWRGDSLNVRRYTLRVDGFVSVNAPLSGGELVTKPFVFEGDELRINFSTSAAGSIGIELQDAQSNPIEGYTLEDCPEVFGDSLAYRVSWEDSSTVSELAGKPVRLRFVLNDADVYAFQFK